MTDYDRKTIERVVKGALDKLVPKAVVPIIPQKYGELDVKYKCPSCHVALPPIPFGITYSKTYLCCFNCGQQLDWDGWNCNTLIQEDEI